jgi:hypothetical protein
MACDDDGFVNVCLSTVLDVVESMVLCASLPSRGR